MSVMQDTPPPAADRQLRKFLWSARWAPPLPHQTPEIGVCSDVTDKCQTGWLRVCCRALPPSAAGRQLRGSNEECQTKMGYSEANAKWR